MCVCFVRARVCVVSKLLSRMQGALKVEPCSDVLAIMCIAAARSNDLPAARDYLVSVSRRGMEQSRYRT